MSILNNILTGKDNKTHDLIKYCSFLIILECLGLEIFSIITGIPFNITEYSTGFGVLLTTISTSLKIKESTEPAQ